MFSLKSLRGCRAQSRWHPTTNSSSKTLFLLAINYFSYDSTVFPWYHTLCETLLTIAVVSVYSVVSCLISLLLFKHGFIFLFNGIYSRALSPVCPSLFLLLPHSVSRFSNKYDKWGYWCFKNELWSESLLMFDSFNDVSWWIGVQSFSLHVTYCFAIEHILFVTVKGTA